MAKPGGLKNKGRDWQIEYRDLNHVDMSVMETCELVRALRFSVADTPKDMVVKELLRYELSKREHLRTKAQAKADRQAAARAKRYR